MDFKSISIKNFRNFEKVKVDLSNQNVIFGMNDVGKTNFLYAIRFLLDSEIRRNGFKKSDFFKNEEGREINITVELDLSDRDENEDTQNFISKVGGYRNSSNLNVFYLQVISKYESADGIGNPELFWGVDLEELSPIPQIGIRSDLDKVFKVVYIHPTINLEQLFSKNRSRVFDQTKLTEQDQKISKEIEKLGQEMNTQIATMETIQNFEELLTAGYKKLKEEDIQITFKSEMTIKGYFNDLVPYIKKDSEDQVYPTSGDGRKKILAYSLLNHLTEIQEDTRIPIFLIEEPENSLHRSMQIALSQQLFSTGLYKYFFLSTHSSELLYEMDNATLVRIFSKDKIVCESALYNLDTEYKALKKELNKSLAEALFSEKVLLIEGPSEKVLFEKILQTLHPTYELKGGYLLEVDGIKFKPYFEILSKLGIICIVKTDNDLKAKRNNKYSLDTIGFNRCLALVGKRNLPAVTITFKTDAEKKKVVQEQKKKLYAKKQKVLKELNSNNIFLSEIDLEHDLNNAIGSKMKQVFGSNPISYLQQHKLLNMIDLTKKLTKVDCEDIINHQYFVALKKLVEL